MFSWCVSWSWFEKYYHSFGMLNNTKHKGNLPSQYLCYHGVLEMVVTTSYHTLPNAALVWSAQTLLVDFLIVWQTATVELRIFSSWKTASQINYSYKWISSEFSMWKVINLLGVCSCFWHTLHSFALGLQSGYYWFLSKNSWADLFMKFF